MFLKIPFVVFTKCILIHICKYLMLFSLCSFLFQRLARTGIIVTTSEAILLQLVADKEHPKFKEIQNLIKASAPESGLLSKV